MRGVHADRRKRSSPAAQVTARKVQHCGLLLAEERVGDPPTLRAELPLDFQDDRR